MASRYDVVIIGTGFASSFFLSAYLDRASPRARVLVLERGTHDTHRWQIDHRRNSRSTPESMFHNATPSKPWLFTPGFGGGSNCWWAVTPRMLPNDFRLYSRYGVGVDWPIDYDDLAPFYREAERIMSISGSGDSSPFPGIGSYPQPPHRLTDPDRLLKAAYPDSFFHQPTARARVATDGRPACCASGVCHLCPIDAKFTIQNGMQRVYDDARVTLRLEATAEAVTTSGSVATGVAFRVGDREETAEADLVVLGANAIFNAELLLRSGLESPALGRRLNEQVAVGVRVKLAGVNNFQGSTSLTGHGYMFYDGDHRRERAGCLLETSNVIPGVLRQERGRWRESMEFKLIFEDLPSEQNAVTLTRGDPGRPTVTYRGHSPYAQRGIDAVPAMMSELGRALPIESYQTIVSSTEAHIQGTTVMGTDPGKSVIDKHLLHQRLRNLVVAGSGAFPTCPPANPTLTICALSLWSAHHLFG
jgi:choline dehydrogenase-like flavoprotein